MKSHTQSLTLKFTLLATALSLAIVSIGCGGGSSVADNASTTATPATASATPADVATSSTQTIPSPVVSPTPVGPTGQATPSSPFDVQPGETKEFRNGMPIMVSKAKPAMTPTPDPFPPRPEPPVVMENGKIKQQWPAAAEAASLTSPVKNRPDAARLGMEYYLQKCSDCHGRSGKGNGWMSAMTKRDGKALPATNLASKAVQANTDGELFWKITNGKSPMPAHRIRFDDEQRWLIVAYLRTLRP
ncbi:MAG: c-type cytochrome [Blastocatellia bacterium]